MGMVKDCRVLHNATVAEDTMLMHLDFGAGENVLPGQFIHIRALSRPDLILRRPISINSYDAASGRLDIIYQVKGAGTLSLAAAQPGNMLDVYGPAGPMAFSPLQGIKHGWLVGGGIGCAPLKYVPEFYNSISFAALLGFRNADCIYQLDEFQRLCDGVSLVTDDGSAGAKGFVTDVVRQRLLAGDQPDAILSCGPEPMLKSLRAVLDECDPNGDVQCFASLEQRMGCGMGACYTCTCPTQEGNARVCADGPVFDIREVF